jgi:hypothetical protein
MVANNLLPYRCILYAFVATCTYGAAMEVSSQPAILKAGADINLPDWVSEPKPACKGKGNGDNCWYAPFGLKDNWLFDYTHDQQLDKSIKEVLEDYGFHERDFKELLAIESRTGNMLDTNFLYLADIFDGAVTPNDFPVKVFLREVWKGKCDGDDECAAARGPLYDACDGRNVGEPCTYESLQLEREKIKKVMPYTFKGECAKGENFNWCKFLKPKEQMVEACVGKKPGRMCAYSLEGKGDMYKGTCMGGDGGMVLWCDGVKTADIEACDGKRRGAKCNAKSDGWCLYVGSNLQCMKEAPKPGAKCPEPEPEPEPEPAGSAASSGSCKGLEKTVSSMKGMIWKISEKMGIPSEEPTKPPEKGRRRRRTKGSKRRRGSRRKGGSRKGA